MRASDSRICSSSSAAVLSSSSSRSFRARVSSITAVASCPAFFSAPTFWLKLVAARLQLFGLRNRLAPALVKGSKIAQQCRRVGAPGTQFLFHFFQVAPDKSQVEHLLSVYSTGHSIYLTSVALAASSPAGPAAI